MNHILRIFISFLLPYLSFSQVNITYNIPTENTVCDTVSFEVTVTNTASDSIKDVATTISLPSGVTYVDNTIFGAIEQDVSNINTPIFELSNLASGTFQTFRFDVFYRCELVDSINNGLLFTNSITVNHQTGSQTVTTIPYRIETPLLIITETTNETVIGTRGDIRMRTYTIQNTRLGALSFFSFEDQHQGGIELSTNYGTVINNSSTNYEVLLGPDDFMNIGDGDGLFELNEVITITETILITSCGYDENRSDSDIIISWGCGGETCRQALSTAIVRFTANDDNPVIVGSTTTEFPTNYCAELSTQQSLTISNIGNATGTNIRVKIDQTHLLQGIGMLPNTFTIDSSGVPITFDLEFLGPADFAECADASIGYAVVNFVIPTLAPGTSIVLSWDVYACTPDCPDAPVTWLYEMDYFLNCPEGEEVESAGDNAGDFSLESPIADFVSYQIRELFFDGDIHTLNYELVSDLLVDSTGILHLEFVIPCGFEWVSGNNLSLSGNAPIGFSTQSNAMNSVVIFEYQLPMDVDSLFTTFDLQFSCDADCLSDAQYIEQYNSSCSTIDLCVGDTTSSDILQVNTAFILDDISSPECALLKCQEAVLQYYCENGQITQIYPPGYLDYQLESFRKNYGLKDDNDDRIADGNGVVNLDLVRRDRLIPGDTLRTLIDGTVLIDLMDSTLTTGSIVLNIASHLVDDNIDDGYWLGVENQTLMAEGGIIPIGAVLKIHDSSTGMSYECPVDPQDTLFLQTNTLTIPNTRPVELEDAIIYTSYIYNISPVALQACLPADYSYDNADRIEFVALHRMLDNPLEFRPNGNPRIINLRTSSSITLSNPFGVEFSCSCPYVNWQYSPYSYRLSPGIYQHPPCESTTGPKGQEFSFKLGLGNFFPYEVRNLAFIEEWIPQHPNTLNLSQSTLTNIELQEGIILGSNIPLIPNQSYDPVLALYQTPLLDEGFTINLDHEFQRPCTKPPFNGYISSDRLKIRFAESLPMQQNPIDTTIQFSANHVTAQPFLTLAATQANYVSFDNMAQWDFILANNQTNYTEPTENIWLTINSFSGLLSDFQLININTGEEFFPQNGIYQLGAMDTNSFDQYRLLALNSSCALEQLVLSYGWNCTPYTSTAQQACDIKSFNLTVSSPRGELELDITTPNTPIDLCETLPYHTVEIFNAELGAVYNIYLEAEIPDGMLIIPGSCQIAYPTGSTFMDIPDPTDLGNGIFRWDIANLNDLIAANGLAGFGSTPNHSVSIRFETTTSCGFVSGSQIIFTTSATQNCEDATNTLSKPGEPLFINGVAIPYDALFTITPSSNTTVACGDEFSMTVSMQADGVTLSGDSISIHLPAGIFFNENSYNPLANANPEGPTISFDSSGQVLTWGILENIPANTPVRFALTLEGFSDSGCGTNSIFIESTQRQVAICSLTGEVCTAFTQTGNSSLEINIDQPTLAITNFGGAYENGVFTFDLEVNNSSTINGQGLNIDFYIDLDNNGILSPGDSLLNTNNYLGLINSNSTTMINGSFAMDNQYLCNLIAVLDEENNCTCTPDVSPLQLPLFNTLPNIIACPDTDVAIGIVGDINGTYQWTPTNNLDCSDCPMPTINLANPTDIPFAVSYTLIENLGSCTINHEQVINVPAEPGIVNDNPSICLGEAAILNAESGQGFNWSGEGITNPTLASQTVSPVATTTYALTITDNNNCIGMDEIEVIVHPSPVVNAGTDEEYCEEELASLSATLDEDYAYQWSPADQLDNPNSPNPTITNNETNTYTLTVTDENNCTAADAVTVTFDEGPELSVLLVEQTVCNGQVVTLEVSGGQDYEWLSNAGVQCLNADCSMIETSPLETTVYTVFGYNENGCESTATLLVNVSTDTLQGEEILYLCKGDSLIIDGEVFFTATTLCDTLVTENGCDSIHCIKIIEADLPDFIISDDITVEAGMDVSVPLDANYSYQWESQPPGISQSCMNCSEMIFNLEETTEFSVTITSDEGCTTSRPSRIDVFPVCAAVNVKPPNIFTPNGDGISDKFGYYIPENHLEVVRSMKIYNRWGSIVYEGQGESACWDGTYKNEPLPQDVYIYIILVGCSNRAYSEVIQGDLTLIR